MWAGYIKAYAKTKERDMIITSDRCCSCTGSQLSALPQLVTPSAMKKVWNNDFFTE
jgi:hypothetical protein